MSETICPICRTKAEKHPKVIHQERVCINELLTEIKCTNEKCLFTMSMVKSEFSFGQLMNNWDRLINR